MSQDKQVDKLAALKAELDAASAKRAAESSVTVEASMERPASQTPASGSVDDTFSALVAEYPELESARESALEWLESINLELKDVRPTTILLIFGLGVLAGRLSL